jgi:hypothetical protein
MCLKSDIRAAMLIQASESEVERTNENLSERLELVQGGYLGSLGVFHELHCLVCYSTVFCFDRTADSKTAPVILAHV